jgi:WD40 repeat protein
VARIFISYARLDAPLAEALERSLSSLGLTTWRDKRDIETDWSREIAQALVQSTACCVLWTEQAAGSHWVQHEWLTARALEKSLHVVASHTGVALPLPLRNTELITGSDAGEWANEIARRTRDAPRPAFDYTIVPQGSWLPFLPDPRFAGRQSEFVDLYLLVMGGLNAMGRSVVGLVGLGGSGKTGLAVEFSYRFAFAFDRVLWLQGANSSTWRPQLARIARDLVGIATDPGDDGMAVRRLGAAVASKRTLLVVDNVEDPRLLNREGVLGTDVPVTMLTLGASVLFTSRTAHEVAAAHYYEVLPLDKDTAVRVLTAGREAVGEKEAEAIAQILDLTGGLPLALSLANAFLRAHIEVGYRKFADALRARMFATLDALGVSSEALATRHDAALSATLNWHMESLREPHAITMLETLALYPDASIVTHDALEIATGLESNTEALVSPFASALYELERLHLAEPVGKSAVRLHPMVRAFVVEHTPEDERLRSRERGAARVRACYESIPRLLAHYQNRGLGDVIDDVVRAGEWAPVRSDDRQWLMTLRKVLEREAFNLSFVGSEENTILFLQQVGWRYRDLGQQRALAFEAALHNLGVAHLSAVQITPNSDPSLLREAISSIHENHSVSHVAVHEASGTLISWTWDRGVVWDLERLQPRFTIAGGATYLFALAITAGGDGVRTVDAEGVLREFDLATGEIRRTLQLKMPGGAGRDFKPRASTFARGASQVIVAFDDRDSVPKRERHRVGHGRLVLWEIDPNGNVLQQRLLSIRAKWLNSVHMDVDDGWLYVPGPDEGTVDVFDVQSGALVMTLAGNTSSWSMSPPDAVAASRTLGVAAVQLRDDVAIWDLRSGVIRHVYQGGYSHAVLALDIESEQLVVAGKRDVTRFDLASGAAVRHHRAIDSKSVAIDARRRVLVVGGPNGLLTTWDLTAPGEAGGFLHSSEVRRLVLKDDGAIWLSLSESELALWTTTTEAQVLRSLESRFGYLNDKSKLVERGQRVRVISNIVSFDVHPASGRLLLVGSDGTWAMQQLDHTGTTGRTAGAAGRIPYAECGFVDKGQLAVLVRADGSLDIVDLARGTKTVMRTGLNDVAGAGFASDVPVVAVGSPEGRVELIDVRHRRLLWSFDHGINQASRNRFMYWNRAGEAAKLIRVSPTADFLVLGFIDERPVFVDRRRGTTTTVSVAHEHIVWAAAIDADEGLAATGDERRRVVVWDINTGNKIAQVFIDAPVTALEFRRGMLAIGDRRGRTYLARPSR